MTSDRPRPASPEPKRPYHLGVALGLTTGVYAMSLLVTTTFQVDHDRALIVDRDPVQAAIDALDRHHDLMEASLLRARLRYEDGSAGYAAIAERLAALEARLAETDRSVSAAEKLGASLPGELYLPNIPRSKPRSGSSGGGRSGGVTLPPAPPAVTPPSTDGTTGASGAP